MASYRGLLSALREGAGAGDRRTAARQLRLPWCWPQDQDLEARARALGSPRPEPPRPGEVLLLCALEDRREAGTPEAGALYACLDGQRGAWPAELRQPAAEDQLEVARRAESETFELGRLPFLHAPPPSRLERATPTGDHAVEGRSFRLAFLLGAVSWLVQRPLPVTVAATADVSIGDAHLTLGPVAGLAAKLTAVAEHALAVEEVWVEAEQVDEAQAILQSLPRPLRVRGAHRPAEVIAAIWGSDLTSARLEGAELERRVDEIHLACLDGTAPFQSWARVAEMVGAAAEARGVGPETVRKARVVEAICTRHDGRPRLWPEAAPPVVARPLRLLEAAQRLQHALDSGAPASALEAALAEARTLLAPPVERHREDWILLSAMGRALGGLAREAEASPLLHEALAGMAQLGLWGDTSFALSELARVSGILGERAPVEHVEALDRHRRWAVRPGPSRRNSDLFVDFALGRAWAQLGEVDRARSRLEPIESADFEPFVVEGAVLWRARAEIAAPPPLLRVDRDEARAARARLEALARRPVERQIHNARVLARLDLARLDDDFAGIQAALARYSEIWPGEAARMFPGLEGRALGDALAARSRY